MESLEEDENRSPDAQDMEMAQQYRSRGHQHQTFVKTEGSVAGDTPYLANAPPSELNVQLEQPGDMDRLPQKSIINLPPGRRDGSQGYVETDEIFKELFGEDSDSCFWSDRD